MSVGACEFFCSWDGIKISGLMLVWQVYQLTHDTSRIVEHGNTKRVIKMLRTYFAASFKKMCEKGCFHRTYHTEQQNVIQAAEMLDWWWFTLSYYFYENSAVILNFLFFIVILDCRMCLCTPPSSHWSVKPCGHDCDVLFSWVPEVGRFFFFHLCQSWWP